MSCSSSDDSTGSPFSTTDEMDSSTTDQNQIIVCTGMEIHCAAATSSNADDAFIEMGACGPAHIADVPTGIPTLSVHNQPTDWDPHRTEPDVQIPYAADPVIGQLIQANEFPLSPALQNVTGYDNTTDDVTLYFHERETLGEPIQHDDDDIQLIYSESMPVQTSEVPAPDLPIDEQIDHVLREPIPVIDLTNDDDEPLEILQIQSPISIPAVLIALTSLDDEEEEQEVRQTPLVSNSEEDHQPESDLPATTVENTVSKTVSSLEAADPNLTIAAANDNAHELLETSAHLQIPQATSRTHKRSASADDIDHISKKPTARCAKRCRTTV